MSASNTVLATTQEASGFFLLQDVETCIRILEVVQVRGARGLS